MSSTRIASFLAATAIVGALAYLAWIRPAPAPASEPVYPNYGLPRAAPPPSQPVPEVVDTALGIGLQLPAELTRVTGSNVATWRSADLEVQVERLDAAITNEEAALATIGGRTDVMRERRTPAGGLLLVKPNPVAHADRGHVWTLLGNGKAWWRAHCRGRGDAEAVCGSLRLVP